MAGITGFGAYVPRLRLQRQAIVDAHKWADPALAGKAKGERSMCNWDEDAVTMGVEAARGCLDGSEAAPDIVYFASTSAPFADRQNAGIDATPESAKSMGKESIVSVKALQLALSNGSESGHNSWDGSYFHTTRIAAGKAYKEAGIDKPRDQVSMFECHDCFSITELVTMEDLQLSPEGGAIGDVMDGFYDADGQIPCQIDGGLKCFGHPIGASGIRMLYEMYLQLQGRADARQLGNPSIGMTHNLGGSPMSNVAAVCIIGAHE